MPRRTKSSIHRNSLRPTPAPAMKRRYYCDIGACNKNFKNTTDLSRHKWKHLADNLYPTCTFESNGKRCSVKYKGRASEIKKHWERHHPGPYPSNVEWPSLASILLANNATLEEINPSTFIAPIGPPALSSDQLADFEWTEGSDSLGMQPQMHFSPDQYQFVAEQGYNFAQQYVQPSFNNDSLAIPQYHQYGTPPIHSSVDHERRQTMWGHQYAPDSNNSTLGYGGHHGIHHESPVVPPFHKQVENQGWDNSLIVDPMAFEPEYSQFEM